MVNSILLQNQLSCKISFQNRRQPPGHLVILRLDFNLHRYRIERIALLIIGQLIFGDSALVVN